MEEILLHGKVLGSYSKHDSHLRLWGGECEVELRSLKLFNPDRANYLTSIFYLTQKKENVLFP